MYFAEVLNNGEKINPASDAATENFTELLIQEAKVEDMYNEKSGKV